MTMVLIVLLLVLFGAPDARAAFAIFQVSSNINFLLDGSGGTLTDNSGGGLIAA